MTYYFPLLRLPWLAFDEILKTMDPIQILNMCQVSKKCKFITQRSIKTGRYHMTIVSHRDSNYIKFGFPDSHQSKFGINFGVAQSSSVLRFSDGTDYPVNLVYHEDFAISTWIIPEQGFMIVMSFLADVLNIRQVEFDKEEHSENKFPFLRIMEHAALCKLHFIKLRLFGNFHRSIRIYNTIINVFMNNATEESELYLESYVTDCYKFTKCDRLKFLRIDKTVNFSMEMLLSLTYVCSSVELGQIALSTEILKEFLTAWEKYPDSRLKRLQLNREAIAERLNLVEVLETFDPQIIGEDMRSQQDIRENQMYTIKWNGDLRATVIYVGDQFVMEIES